MAMVPLYDGWIDEAYLKDNIGEATGLDWQPVAGAEIGDHFHCVVCVRAVPWDSTKAYRAAARYLCGDCNDQFVAGS